MKSNMKIPPPPVVRKIPPPPPPRKRTQEPNTTRFDAHERRIASLERKLAKQSTQLHEQASWLFEQQVNFDRHVRGTLECIALAMRRLDRLEENAERRRMGMPSLAFEREEALAAVDTAAAAAESSPSEVLTERELDEREP